MRIAVMQKGVNKMATNRGKQFENVIKEAFERAKDTVVIRLHDQTNGFMGSKNPCDFIVYHDPKMFAIECKSIHGATFPLSNITDNQYKELLKMSAVKGVCAGVIVWWIDYDVTIFFDISWIKNLKEEDYKSIHYSVERGIKIPGKKKRVFFEYDMEGFFNGLRY